MIFKQISEILEGRKTQTRRVCKPSETFSANSGPSGRNDIRQVYSSGRLKWETGRTYAVVPKRGQTAVWWREKDELVEYLHEHPKYSALHEIMAPMSQRTRQMAFDDMRNVGYQPLRIRITAIRREGLHAITEADARAEGVESVGAYRALWGSINGKTPGARWADNPEVWVLSFELVRSL